MRIVSNSCNVCVVQLYVVRRLTAWRCLKLVKFGPYMERTTAKDRGWIYYMTGRPCKNGHVDKKLTSSNKCSSCQTRTDARRAYEAEWKMKRRQDADFLARENEQRQKWLSKPGVRAALYERNASSARQKYKSEPEYKAKVDRSAKNWAAKNPEKRSEISRRYRERHPEKVKAANNSRRVHRSITRGKLEWVDIKDIFKKSFGFCTYCSAHLFDGYHLDHIMPISLGGGNEMDNLQCICAKCNLRKRDKHPEDWHEEIGWHPTERIKG